MRNSKYCFIMIKNNSFTILIGVNDLVRPTMSSIIEFYNAEHGTKLKLDDIKSLNYNENFPEISDISSFKRKYSCELFYDSIPFDNAKEIISDLHKKHNIIFFEPDVEGLEGLTRMWLKNNLVHDRFIFSRNISPISVDIFLDDDVGNLENKYRPNLIMAKHTACFRKPWNEHYAGTKISSLISFFNYVTLLETNKSKYVKKKEIDYVNEMVKL